MSTKFDQIPGQKTSTATGKPDEAAKGRAQSEGKDPTSQNPSSNSSNLRDQSTSDEKSRTRGRQSHPPTPDAKQVRRIASKPNIARSIKLYKLVKSRHQAAQLARLRTNALWINSTNNETLRCVSGWRLGQIHEHVQGNHSPALSPPGWPRG